jgi:hypothetical protein
LPLYVKVQSIIEVDGTMEQADQVKEKVLDLIADGLDIHCGDPECCPEPRRPDQVVGFAYSISTITDNLDEED